jgi:hypothetical protein
MGKPVNLLFEEIAAAKAAGKYPNLAFSQRLFINSVSIRHSRRLRFEPASSVR